MKDSIKIVKEGKLSCFFFLQCAQCFTYPSLFSFLFSSSSTILLFSVLNFFRFFLHNFIIFPPEFFYSLDLNFNIFPPHSWIPSSTILIFAHLLLILEFPPPQFYYFSSTFFLIFLLLHNFYDFPSSILISPSSSTIFIFPPQSWFPSSSTILLFSFHLLVYSIYFPSTNTSTLYRPYIDPTLTPHRPYIDPTSTHHYHHHHHHLSIIFLADRLFEFGLFGLMLAILAWGCPFWPESGLSFRETIEMWWWWRENNRNVVVLEGKQ